MSLRLTQILFTLAALILVGLGHAAARAEGGYSGFVPEVYLPSGYGGCVLRVDLLNHAEGDRKRILLTAVDAAFEHTGRWTKDFVVSGVDYLRFSSFHVISFGACDSVAATTGYFASVLPDGGYALKALEGDQNLYTSTDVLDAEGPLGIFVRLRSEAMIGPCLVSMTLPRDVGTVETALNDAYRIRMKYRPPLADIALMDNILYLLFSEDCGEKQRLSETILELLERENAGSVGSWSPDYQPAPEAYVRHRTGE